MFYRNFNIKTIVKQIKHNYNYCRTALTVNSYQYNKNVSKHKPDLIADALKVIAVNKPEDWCKVQEFILNHESNCQNMYNATNIDGRIMKYALNNNNLSHAESYFLYLEQNNKKPNLATIGLYLGCLCSEKLEDISSAKQKKILELCNNVRDNYSVLDSITLEHIVGGLSFTNQWKDCLDLIKEIKLTSVPTSRTYSLIIAAAFLNKEEQLAWELFNEMLQHEKVPLSVIYHSYLKMTKRLRKRDNIIRNLEKLFEFMKENSLVCSQDVTEDFLSFGKKSDSIVTINFSGHCSGCKNNLVKFELTKEEFVELKAIFLKNAIIGKDIFIKSNPTEMGRFEEFVKSMGKFDVVLDGLNIAYSCGIGKGPQVYSNIVAAVISYFVEQNKSVLMLGRNHMARWPRNSWNYIKNNATIFLTSNISQDDPYLLYCALNSGPDTILVSRDLMRSHKFLLQERKYKLLFDKWLFQRQYHLLALNAQNKPIFRIPPNFSPIAQKCKEIWHIPYKVESTSGDLNEKYQRTWICLNLGK